MKVHSESQALQIKWNAHFHSEYKMSDVHHLQRYNYMEWKDATLTTAGREVYNSPKHNRVYQAIS